MFGKKMSVAVGILGCVAILLAYQNCNNIGKSLSILGTDSPSITDSGSGAIFTLVSPPERLEIAIYRVLDSSGQIATRANVLPGKIICDVLPGFSNCMSDSLSGEVTGLTGTEVLRLVKPNDELLTCLVGNGSFSAPLQRSDDPRLSFANLEGTVIKIYKAPDCQTKVGVPLLSTFTIKGFCQDGLEVVNGVCQLRSNAASVGSVQASSAVDNQGLCRIGYTANVTAVRPGKAIQLVKQNLDAGVFSNAEVVACSAGPFNSGASYPNPQGRFSFALMEIDAGAGGCNSFSNPPGHVVALSQEVSCQNGAMPNVKVLASIHSTSAQLVGNPPDEHCNIGGNVQLSGGAVPAGEDVCVYHVSPTAGPKGQALNCADGRREFPFRSTEHPLGSQLDFGVYRQRLTNTGPAELIQLTRASVRCPQTGTSMGSGPVAKLASVSMGVANDQGICTASADVVYPAGGNPNSQVAALFINQTRVACQSSNFSGTRTVADVEGHTDALFEIKTGPSCDQATEVIQSLNSGCLMVGAPAPGGPLAALERVQLSATETSGPNAGKCSVRAGVRFPDGNPEESAVSLYVNNTPVPNACNRRGFYTDPVYVVDQQGGHVDAILKLVKSSDCGVPGQEISSASYYCAPASPGGGGASTLAVTARVNQEYPGQPCNGVGTLTLPSSLRGAALKLKLGGGQGEFVISTAGSPTTGASFTFPIVQSQWGYIEATGVLAPGQTGNPPIVRTGNFFCVGN